MAVSWMSVRSSACYHSFAAEDIAVRTKAIVIKISSFLNFRTINHFVAILHAVISTMDIKVIYPARLMSGPRCSESMRGITATKQRFQGIFSNQSEHVNNQTQFMVQQKTFVETKAQGRILRPFHMYMKSSRMASLNKRSPYCSQSESPTLSAKAALWWLHTQKYGTV